MGLTGIDLVGLSSGHAAGRTRYVQTAITGDETTAFRAVGAFLSREDEALTGPVYIDGVLRPTDALALL